MYSSSAVCVCVVLVALSTVTRGYTYRCQLGVHKRPAFGRGAILLRNHTV